MMSAFADLIIQLQCKCSLTLYQLVTLVVGITVSCNDALKILGILERWCTSDQCVEGSFDELVSNHDFVNLHRLLQKEMVSHHSVTDGCKNRKETSPFCIDDSTTVIDDISSKIPLSTKEDGLDSGKEDFDEESYYASIVQILKKAAGIPAKDICSRYPELIKSLQKFAYFGPFRSNLFLQLSARVGITTVDVGACGGVWDVRHGAHKFIEDSFERVISVQEAQAIFKELLKYYQGTIKRYHFTAQDLASMLNAARCHTTKSRPKKDILRVESNGELHNVISVRKKKKKGRSGKGYAGKVEVDFEYRLCIHAGGYYTSSRSLYQDLSEAVKFHWIRGSDSNLDDWTQRGGYVHTSKDKRMPRWVAMMRLKNGAVGHFHSNIAIANPISTCNGEADATPAAVTNNVDILDPDDFDDNECTFDERG